MIQNPCLQKTFTFGPEGYLLEVQFYYVHDYSGNHDSTMYSRWEEYNYNSYDIKGRLTRMVKQGKAPEIWGFRYYGDTLIVTTLSAPPYKSASEYRSHFSPNPPTEIRSNLITNARTVPSPSKNVSAYSILGRRLDAIATPRSGIYLYVNASGNVEKVFSPQLRH